MAAPRRRGRLGLARRSGRPQTAADDLDPVVLGLQLYRRLLPDFHVPVRGARPARNRHGRGMACRRHACDGVVAGTLPRPDGCRDAGILGNRICALQYGVLVLYDEVGWRGLLWIGILPALLCVYIRYFVKEPPVSVENRKRQREGNREVRAPLTAIFRRGLLFNTLTACWWMTGHMVIYYSIYGLFATWLQTELKVSAAVVATPVLL